MTKTPAQRKLDAFVKNLLELDVCGLLQQRQIVGEQGLEEETREGHIICDRFIAVIDAVGQARFGYAYDDALRAENGVPS